MASLLVVDDDPGFLEVICLALRAEGFAVGAAVDGRQALATIEAEAPDVLVTDIFMPDIDGIALISAILRSFPSVRIVAMSGAKQLHSLDVLNLAAKMGAHATIAKPFSVEELVETIAETLRIAPSATRQPSRP